MCLKESIQRIWSILDDRQKKGFLLIVVFVLFFSFLEMTVTGSLLPFLNALENPANIKNDRFLQTLHTLFGSPKEEDFVYIIGGSILVIALSKSLLLYFITYKKATYSNHVYMDMSIKILKTYLNLPYSYYLNKNTNVMLKNVTNEILSIKIFLFTIIDLILSICVFFFIMAMIAYIDPLLIIFGSAFSTGSIIFIYMGLKGRTSEEGRKAEINFRGVFQSGKQALEGYKEIRHFGRIDAFIAKYRESMVQHIRSSILLSLYKNVPGIILEFLILIFMFAAIFYFSLDKGDFSRALPLLGLLAMAGRKIAPAIMSINSSINQLKSFDAPIKILTDILRQYKYNDSEFKSKPKFDKSISLSNISFKYENASRHALSNVDIEIPKGSKVGIVGLSGSGKTTLIDLLLGFHEEYEGAYCLDGMELSREQIQSFQSLVAFVPQDIYLLDETIQDNILFGDTQEVDREKIEKVVEISQLGAFLEGLDKGLQEYIGERGIKLSGGERQRMGMARAIFKDPEVFILDEATSSLDNKTEALFQKAVESFSKNRTLIIVAHRLTTVRDCDIIYVMHEGNVIDSGSYEFLAKNSDSFKDLLHKSEHPLGVGN